MVLVLLLYFFDLKSLLRTSACLIINRHLTYHVFSGFGPRRFRVGLNNPAAISLVVSTVNFSAITSTFHPHAKIS